MNLSTKLLTTHSGRKYAFGAFSQLELDAAYAHALVNAMESMNFDGWSVDAFPMQIAFDKSDELMTKWGYAEVEDESSK